MVHPPPCTMFGSAMFGSELPKTYVMARPRRLLLGIHGLAPTAHANLPLAQTTPGKVPETDYHTSHPAAAALTTTIPGTNRNALPASPHQMAIQPWGGCFETQMLIQRWESCSDRSYRLGSTTGRGLHTTNNSAFLISPGLPMHFTMVVQMVLTP